MKSTGTSGSVERAILYTIGASVYTLPNKHKIMMMIYIIGMFLADYESIDKLGY